MNNNKQSKLNSGRVRSLGLLDKTLPLTAATPPQLRNRRQFQFNGMHFETNPLSLHMARSGLDGDAGDARFPGPLQDWRDPPYQTYKTSSSSTANRVSTQRGSVSPVNENPSHRAASQPIVSPGQSQLHQPEERSWRTDGTDNNQAGGEDAYNSNSYNMNHNNNNNNCNSFNMNNKINDNMNNNNNNYTQSNFNNNNNGNVNNDRFHQVLAKYNRSPNVDDYNNNNNSILSSNSFRGGSFENETKMKDDQSADRDHYAKEELQLPSRIYNRPLKVTGFRYGQMRAGGGFNAGAVTQSKMDYITLTGFLLGYLTSNVLFFLCWYFSWLKAQVVKLRQHFLGQTNLWEFFDFEDTTRYSMQTKLLLAPIILGCSILYCIVNMLHLLIKLVRSDVPRTVVDFVQRIAKSHWS